MYIPDSIEESGDYVCDYCVFSEDCPPHATDLAKDNHDCQSFSTINYIKAKEEYKKLLERADQLKLIGYPPTSCIRVARYEIDKSKENKKKLGGW